MIGERTTARDREETFIKPLRIPYFESFEVAELGCTREVVVSNKLIKVRVPTERTAGVSEELRECGHREVAVEIVG